MKKALIISILCATLLALNSCKSPVAIQGQLYQPSITYGNGQMCILLDGYIDYNPNQLAALLKAGATIELLGIKFSMRKDTIDSSNKFIGHAEKCLQVK